MLFSDYFQVDKDIIREYGAVNISLYSDTPLFIDPILVYGNDNPDIRKQYHNIVKYLLFLNSVASNPNIDEKSKNYYFNFKEVKHNWLGLCKVGNCGNAIGNEFAGKLFNTISLICNTGNISKEIHIEKMFLVDSGVGKDRISDWTARMLLDYLVDYTETFAQKYIAKEKCDYFGVERCGFDYTAGTFKSRKAYLPFIINSKGKKEYVLLTPSSILRKDEQEISSKNFESTLDVLFNTISDDDLRFQVNNLYKTSLDSFYAKKRETEDKILTSEIDSFKKETYLNIINSFPILYDYYVKLEEDQVSSTKEKANRELKEVLGEINDNELLNSDPLGFGNAINEFEDAYEEALFRINYLKTQIEVNGLWKNFYIDGVPFESEDHLQRLFAVLWCRSSYMFSPEANAGSGPVDFVVSKSRFNSCIIEFKLAKNTMLSHVFKQVDRYKASQNVNKAIIVVFYFNQKECQKALEIKNSSDGSKYDVICIDCSKETKSSASKL